MKGTTSTQLLAATLLLLLATSLVVQEVDAVSVPRICHKKGNYLVENPQDCRSYYYCYQGEPFYGLCAAGHRFDDRSQSCLPATVRECFPCPPSGVVHLPNPVGCDRFVFCFQGVAHERICPEGLLFNKQLGQCDLRHNVVCN